MLEATFPNCNGESLHEYALIILLGHTIGIVGVYSSSGVLQDVCRVILPSMIGPIANLTDIACDLDGRDAAEII